MVTAACSGSGGSQNESGAGEVDPSGGLKSGYPLPVAGAHFDSTQSVLTSDVMWMSMVFGTLMRQRADGTIQPRMAADAEVVDPHTVKSSPRGDVLRRCDVRCAGGADEFNAGPDPGDASREGRNGSGMKALEGVNVVDPLTITAHLNAPIAGQFMTELSQRGGAIVSPKQAAEAPDQIGVSPAEAGSFALVTNTAQQLLSFRKNPGIWDSEGVQLGGVDIINTRTGPQQANGLLAGNLDWASYVAVDTADRVKTDGQFATYVSTTYNVELMMRAGRAPFDNVKVRQAVQQGIDRERYAQLAYRGYTEPAYSFFRVRAT